MGLRTVTFAVDDIDATVAGLRAYGAADLRPTGVIRWTDQKTTMKEMTVQPNEIIEVFNRPISQELLARDVTRLAYVAKDGTPRNVPIGFTWNGSEIVMCTARRTPRRSRPYATTRRLP